MPYSRTCASSVYLQAECEPFEYESRLDPSLVYLQAECESRGCCWIPSDDGSPFCFVGGCVDPIRWDGEGTGFSQDSLDAYYDK